MTLSTAHNADTQLKRHQANVNISFLDLYQLIYLALWSKPSLHSVMAVETRHHLRIDIDITLTMLFSLPTGLHLSHLKCRQHYGTKKEPLPLSDQNRKSHCFPWSLYSGDCRNNTNCGSSDEGGSEVEEGTDRYGGKTRMKTRSFARSRALVLCHSWFPYWFVLTARTWDEPKLAFFLSDHYATKPAWLFKQPGVLLCLFMALRSRFVGQLGILTIVFFL